MLSRAWWAAVAPAAPLVLVPALLAVVFAVAVDGAEGPLAFVAGLLLAAAGLNAVRRGPLPGTPAQNLGRVVLATATVLAILVLLGVAFVTWLFSGLCGNACADRPWQAHGLLVAAAFVAATVAVAVAGGWLWRHVGRARAGEARTPRALTVLPGAGVALVAAVAALAGEGDPERLRPTGTVQVLWDPCAAPSGGAAAPSGAGAASSGGGRADSSSGRADCGTARTLTTATSGGAVLAAWRTSDAFLGAVVGPDGAVRRIRIAGRLPSQEDVPAAGSVATDPAGGFVAAWTTVDGLHLARVSAGGRVRPLGGVRPGPGDRPELALVATAAGFVAFAVDRDATPSTTGTPQRLRVLALDERLAPRGGWRTVRSPVAAGIGPAALAAGGRAAVTVGAGVVRTTATVDGVGRAPRVLPDRLLVPAIDDPRAARSTRRAARIEPLPGPRDLPVRRRRPELVDALRDRTGALRTLWTTDAPRSEEVPARVRQQWLLGPGGGIPDRPLAEGLVEARLVPTGAGVGIVGLRPTGPGRGADVEVVLVRRD